MSTEFSDNRTQSLDNEASLVNSTVNIGSVSEYLESNVDFASHAISDKVKQKTMKRIRQIGNLILFTWKPNDNKNK